MLPPIDLKKLRRDPPSAPLAPERELPPPPEEELLMTEEAAHPEGFPARSALLSWTAPEFEYDAEQGVLLLILAALLGIGGVVAIFFGNFLFAVLLFLAAGLVASHAFRVPRELQMAVTSAGIKIENRLWEFEDLKSFWVSYDPPLFKDLVLHSKKTFMPLMRAPLGATDPVALRELLLRFLKEERHEESVIDIISKRLGF